MKYVLPILFICGAIGLAWAANLQQVEQRAELLREQTPLDLLDLAEEAEYQRETFNLITPPSVGLFQPMENDVVPFEAARFSSRFLDKLEGIASNAVALYPVFLMLDPETRETVVYNREEKEIARVAVAGLPAEWPKETDPSRIVLMVDLIEEEDVELFAYVEQRIAETRLPTEDPPNRSPSAPTGLYLTLAPSNGAIRIVVTAPEDEDVEIFRFASWYEQVTVISTNTGTTLGFDLQTVITNSTISTNTHWWTETPALTGLDSAWEYMQTLTPADGVAVWLDDTLVPNHQLAFYGAAYFRDSDEDGLSDGMELFVHHTDPDNPDTDGDGWSDGEEVAALTNPLDRLDAPHPARNILIHAICYNPAEGYAASNQWMQLHSSCRYPVDLSGFRIQVAGSEYETKFTFPEGTWLEPGRFFLIGGENVEERDFTADFDFPQSYSSIPTAGVRLMPPQPLLRSTPFPADVLMYGTGTPFNSNNLPLDGWNSIVTTLWAGVDYQLARLSLGMDNNYRSDWHYASVTRPLWNHATILDSDLDGLTDGEEYSGGGNTWPPTDPLNPDSDGDGLEDAFELEHGLNPNSTDSNGNGIPDGDEIDPASGKTYAELQLGSNVEVAISASQSGWTLGSSIGSNGWVRFDLDTEGIGIWATLREGGHTPEAFTYSVTNASITYETTEIINGFTRVNLLLVPTGFGTPAVTVHDGGTYWTNQTPSTLGPDISATFKGIAASVSFADPTDSAWGSLPEQTVILQGQEIRVKVQFLPALPSLQAIWDAWGNTLIFAGNGTASASLTSQNTALITQSDISEMRATLAFTHLSGVLSSATESKAWMDFGETSPLATSNLSDGNAFEEGCTAVSRGKSTRDGNLSSTPPNSPLDKTFFQSAGRDLVSVEYAGIWSGRIQVMNQAKYFYYSGHGSHANGTLEGGLSADDVTGYWDKGVEYVFFAGCSVLDIKDYRARSFTFRAKRQWQNAGGACSPGIQWENTGPKYFLGYNWRAPLDSQGSAEIITAFFAARESGQDVPTAWGTANNRDTGRNACVIDASDEQKIYWYWDEQTGPATWTNAMQIDGIWE